MDPFDLKYIPYWINVFFVAIVLYFMYHFVWRPVARSRPETKYGFSASAKIHHRGPTILQFCARVPPGIGATASILQCAPNYVSGSDEDDEDSDRYDMFSFRFFWLTTCYRTAVKQEHPARTTPARRSSARVSTPRVITSRASTPTPASRASTPTPAPSKTSTPKASSRKASVPSTSTVAAPGTGSSSSKRSSNSQPTAGSTASGSRTTRASAKAAVTTTNGNGLIVSSSFLLTRHSHGSNVYKSVQDMNTRSEQSTSRHVGLRSRPPVQLKRLRCSIERMRLNLEIFS